MLIVALVLSVDQLNPVKIFLHVFTPLVGLTNVHLAGICLFMIMYICFTEAREMVYFGVKVFFHSIISIFFSQVEIIGLQNVPRDGPIIFVGNHANQFVDGIMLMSTVPGHKVSFLVAEKSWNRRIIGDVAYAMGAVPVARAQDKSVKGTGTLTLSPPSDVHEELEDEVTIKVAVAGHLTKFTSELKIGDKVRPTGDSTAFKVVSLDSDTSIVIEVPSTNDILKKKPSPLKFDILARVDQSGVYNKVLAKLEKGGCIGIFPEGGSHDRTDLLPLKVGVALIAYSALDKRGLNIPIIPVGLNYFSAHRFRSRAVVEYGAPIYLNSDTLKDYKEGGDKKRAVCNELLMNIQDGMKSVIVTTPDYQTMKLVHVVRRLWKRGDNVSTQEKQDLNRRFALGFQQLLTKFDGDPPPEFTAFMDEIKSYQAELEDLGIRDYQVSTLEEGVSTDDPTGTRHTRSLSDFASMNEDTVDKVVKEVRIPYRIAHLLFVWGLALIPTIFLNLPVGLLSNIYAERKRKKALAASKVKIAAFDVRLSEKVLFCIAMVPALWVVYGILLVAFTSLEKEAIALAFISMPIFSYMGIMATESGMVDFKDLRPHLKRLQPSTSKRLADLPGKRMRLVKKLKAFVREFGPNFGDLYYETKVDWNKVQKAMTAGPADVSPKLGPVEPKKEK